MIKSRMERSRDCRGDGLEPGCFAALGRLQWPLLCGHLCYHEGEGFYPGQQLGAADILMFLLPIEQFEHSMLQWVLTSVVECQPILDTVCWKKRKKRIVASNSEILKTWLKHNQSIPVSKLLHLIWPFVRSAIKVQPSLITWDNVAKAFGSPSGSNILSTSCCCFCVCVCFAGLLEDEYLSCYDFSQVNIISHNSFSCANWDITSFTHFMNSNYICQSSSISFFTESTVCLFLSETGQPGWWLFQLWIPNSIANDAAQSTVGFIYIHLSNQQGFSCDCLPVPSMWIHRNKVAQLWYPFIQAQLITSHF